MPALFATGAAVYLTSVPPNHHQAAYLVKGMPGTVKEANESTIHGGFIYSLYVQTPEGRDLEVSRIPEAFLAASV